MSENRQLADPVFERGRVMKSEGQRIDELTLLLKERMGEWPSDVMRKMGWLSLRQLQNLERSGLQSDNLLDAIRSRRVSYE